MSEFHLHSINWALQWFNINVRFHLWYEDFSFSLLNFSEISWKNAYIKLIFHFLEKTNLAEIKGIHSKLFSLRGL